MIESESGNSACDLAQAEKAANATVALVRTATRKVVLGSRRRLNQTCSAGRSGRGVHRGPVREMRSPRSKEANIDWIRHCKLKLGEPKGLGDQEAKSKKNVADPTFREHNLRILDYILRVLSNSTSRACSPVKSRPFPQGMIAGLSFDSDSLASAHH